MGSPRSPRRSVRAAAAFLLLAVAGRGRASGAAPHAPSCLDEPPRVTGTIAYYCDCGPGAAAGCVPGDDGNPGTDPARPRRSLADAARTFNGMAAGDTVALCRTGAWSGSAALANPRCRAGGSGWPAPPRNSTTCDLRDYVPRWGGRDSPRPVVNGNLSFNDFAPGQGYRLWNLDLRHAGGDNGTVFVYRDVTHLDLCGLRLDGLSGKRGAGLNIQPSGTGDTHVVVRQCEVRNYGFSGLFGGTHGLTVDACVFENNGLDGGPLTHSLYLGPGSAPQPYGGARILNNRFVTDARCGGVMLVVHARQDDLVVENNHLSTTSTDRNCYGIQTSGSAIDGVFHRAAIRRNRVFLRGQLGIEASGCVDCTVSDNVVVGSVGISANVTCGGTTLPGGAVVLQNNSVLEGAVTVGCDGAGHVVENNAVWTSGDACFVVRRPTLRMGNNHCRTRGGPPAEALWRDPRGGDFRPRVPGPLAGAGNREHFSPTAVGSPTWTADDPGRGRAPPVDAGAFQR